MYLTGKEIRELAEYAGFTIGSIPDLDVYEQEFDVAERKTGIPIEDDNGNVEKYRHAVKCDGCEHNECMPLGEPI